MIVTMMNLKSLSLINILVCRYVAIKAPNGIGHAL